MESHINTDEYYCQPYSKGTYQNTTTFNKSCKLCPTGTYSNKEGEIECTLCNRGSFQPLKGATFSNSRKLCPVGTYQSIEGGIEYISCN